MYTLKVEEWDTNSLQIVEQEKAIAASASPSTPPLLRDSEGEEDSAEMTCDWVQGDAGDAPGDTPPPYSHEQTLTDTQRPSPLVFASGYTTLEMFRQVTPQGVPADTGSSRQQVSGDGLGRGEIRIGRGEAD